ncbi:hypothetical protein FRB91_005479 [Serendipita sp. 411]|nr:hypothetical protein FRB91_005479 [Serendipita sp. 411]
MWKQLKAAYELTTSAGRFNALEALILTKQEGQSLSELLGTVSLRIDEFLTAQPTGYDLNKLMEELFCWTVVRSLDPIQHADLHISLVKDPSIT